MKRHETKGYSSSKENIQLLVISLLIENIMEFLDTEKK